MLEIDSWNVEPYRDCAALSWAWHRVRTRRMRIHVLEFAKRSTIWGEH